MRYGRKVHWMGLVVGMALLTWGCRAAAVGPLAALVATPTPTPTPTFTPTPTATPTPTPTFTPTPTATPTPTPTPTPHPITQVRIFLEDLPPGYVDQTEKFRGTGESLWPADMETDIAVEYAYLHEEDLTLFYGQTFWLNSAAQAAAAQALLRDPDTVRQFVLEDLVTESTFAVQSSQAQPGTVGDQSVHVIIQGQDTDTRLPFRIEVYMFSRGQAFVILLRMGVDFQALGLNISPEVDIALEDLAYLLDLRAQEVQP